MNDNSLFTGIFLGDFERVIEEFTEMPRIGYVPLKTTKYEVWVYSNDEGMTPHFHMFSKGKRFETCIQLDAGNYFLHKPNHTPLSNRSLKKDLIKFLTSTNTNDEHKNNVITNWEAACIFWNQNDDRPNVDISRGMPDYSQLRTLRK